MRLLGWTDLKDRGISWSRQHINRKIRQGEFPPPIKLGAQTNAWEEEIIDRFLENLVAAQRSTGGKAAR